MKKLLMLGAILAMGAVSFAYDSAAENPNTNEASVKVKAELVKNNLVITDLEGNPIVLDFKRVSSLRDKGTSEAQVGYKVRYVGSTSLTGSNRDNKLTMKLKNKSNGAYESKAVPVTLVNIETPQGKKGYQFDVTVGLDAYEGVMPIGKEANHDYAEYVGMVYGTLDHANPNAYRPGEQNTNGGTLFKDKFGEETRMASGHYQGETFLQVTIGA